MGTKDNIAGGIAGGMVWSFEHWDQGKLVESSPLVKNLTPQEMLALNAAVIFEGAVMPSNWYIGLYETDYTPTPTVSAATLNALAVECVAYSNATRPAFVPVSTGIGAVSNDASPVEFQMNAVKTIYGGFVSSQPTKGATTGVLLSVVKIPTFEQTTATSILRVRVSFATYSA